MTHASFRSVLGLTLVLAGFLAIWPGAAGAQGTAGDYAPVRLALIQGSADEIGLVVRLAPGWKFYWRTPGEGGVPAQFDWSESRNLARAEVFWPSPRRIPLGQADIFGYTGEVVLPIRIERQKTGDPVHLRLTLEYGVCKDICILRSDRLRHDETAINPDDTALLRSWTARLPQAAAAAGLRLQHLRLKPDRLIVALHSDGPLRNPDLFVEGTPDSWFGRPQVALMADGREMRFEFPVVLPPSAADRPLRLTLVDPTLSAELVVQP
jgi:suppressor for copper-sensitivity B